MHRKIHDAELADSFEQIIRGAIDAERDAARREGAELRALDEAARDALSPFAAVGQWLFARPEVPDDTPMVDIEGLNGHHAALTRGHFKAAFTAYDALAARPRDVATTEQSDE